MSDVSRASPYLEFSRDEWARLRANTPMTLTEDDVEKLRGINVALSVDEVETIFLPLSRLLNLYVRASQQLFSVTDTFLGKPSVRVPYVVGIAGSVAVGKSTIARILQQLLAHWPDHPRVDLVTTDGFLYPNAVLEERGIMHRKGFPESYDRRRLLQFVTDLKAGNHPASAPVYSHREYDILKGEVRTVEGADIVVIEGLNVLQVGTRGSHVSDYFDFSIFVDADVKAIESWYVERFLTLRDTAFRDPKAYFHKYSALTDDEALAEGSPDLAGDQREEPAREHPAHPRARYVDSLQAHRPLRRARSAATALSTRSWERFPWRCLPASVLGGRLLCRRTGRPPMPRPIRSCCGAWPLRSHCRSPLAVVMSAFSAADVAVGAIAGVFGAAGAVALYHGLARARAAVVAPLAGVVGAALPVIGGVGLGERPTQTAWAGIALALPGIWLLAADRVEIGPGARFGLLAGLGFGLEFLVLGQALRDTGLWPIVGTFVGGGAVIGALAWGRRRRLALSRTSRWLAVGAAVLNLAAVSAFLYATRRGLVSLASVTASMYPAPTVALAWYLDGERIGRRRLAGAVLAVVAVGLIAA